MPRLKTTERIRFDSQTRSDIYHACHCRCAHCGVHLSYSSDFTIEHVIPIAKGGTNDKNNLVALCEDCNRAKGDDVIQPLDYYGHLPKDRLKLIQKLFDKYLHDVDFLDKDNLFKLDRFDLHTNAVAFIKQKKQMLIPTTIHVEKMRKGAAYDWLFENYIGRLCTGDKALMAGSPDGLRDIYKCQDKSGKILFLFSAYVRRIDWEITDPRLRPQGPSRNTLCFDLYFNPEIKIRPYSTIQTLYLYFMSIIQDIQQTFSRIAPCTAIECAIRSPHSDAVAQIFFKFIATGTKHGISSRFREGDEAGDSYCEGVCVVLFNSTVTQGTAFAKQHGHRSVREMIDAMGTEMFEAPIDRALDSIQAQIPEKEPNDKPPKQKASDRKYWSKKKKRKKK